MSLLRYTGHPFVDVGVATITAMSRKRAPTEVVDEDLERVATQLKDLYSTLKPLRNHISSIFLNSWFVQPSKSEADRQQYADEVLFAFRPDRPQFEQTRCSFFAEKPAVTYIHRQHLPLLNGEGISNFSAIGQAGIPVSGVALLAIHAMPLGCIKAGYLLAFHQLQPATGQEHDMTLQLAHLNYQKNLAAIQQMRQDESVEMPNLGGYKRTRYVEALLQVQLQAKQRRVNALNHITGYYFTNYGPKPFLELVRLDNNIAEFVNTVDQDAADAWRRVVWQGWQLEKGENHQTLAAAATSVRRNTIYEQLFELPRTTRPFLRRLAGARDWNLLTIFLRKVMQMEQERINTYRQLGDRLAEYMIKYEGTSMRFYYELFRAKDYTHFRRVLRRAAERVLKAGEPDPLFTYNQFIAAFEQPSQGYKNWKIGRDLISFRVLEMLHERGVDLSQLEEEQEIPTDENDDE